MMAFTQEDVKMPRAFGNAKTTDIALRNNSTHTAAESLI